MTDKQTRYTVLTAVVLLFSYLLIERFHTYMTNKQTTKKNVAPVAVLPVLDSKAVLAVKAKIATAEANVEAAKAVLAAERKVMTDLLAAFNADMSKSLGVNILSGVSSSVPSNTGGSRGSQKQAVLDLLTSSPNGISCKEIAASVGTSEHNIQGTLTGIRRMTPINAVKVDGVTRYSITA